jgi:DNA-binding PadR family transcriptional regulator
MRRGDIRTALLAVLTEGPGHGYEIINRLEEKSGGIWRPSPGSVYPTLQLFEDEGLVRSEERDGKRVYELTDAGRTEAADRAERFGKAPWESEAGHGAGRHDGFRGLRKAGERLGPVIPPFLMALRHVGMSGDSDELERASAVVQRATKELYQILAGHEPG